MKSTLLKSFGNVLILVYIFALIPFTGCSGPETKESADTSPVFFPPPPNTPRLQFLTSFSGGKDFQKNQSSFLETYVLGEKQEDSRLIVQPYGVSVHESKIYVCDVGHGNIKVMDIANKTFSTFDGGRTLQNPVNIYIEPDGTKYIADPKVGAIVVYDNSNNLIGFLGNRLKIKPVDVMVKDGKVYFTDANNNQVFVLDKTTGQFIKAVGKNITDQSDWAVDEFAFIACVAVDSKNDIYVSDKIKGRITTFDSKGHFKRFYGRPGSLPDSIVRGKGMAFDREDRLWVVDAGPANAVKVFRKEDGRILMYFGTLGKEPGQMYMPANVYIDYDHMDLFKKYAVDGSKLEFLVFVTNQYGDQKVSVYGFGTFPEKYRREGVLTDDQINTDVESDENKPE